MLFPFYKSFIGNRREMEFNKIDMARWCGIVLNAKGRLFVQYKLVASYLRAHPLRPVVSTCYCSSLFNYSFGADVE